MAGPGELIDWTTDSLTVSVTRRPHKSTGAAAHFGNVAAPPRARKMTFRGAEVLCGSSQRNNYCLSHVISTRTGISFLMGTVRNDGRSILKSEQSAGIVPVMRTAFPCCVRWKDTCV